jgi:hypothetical protein
MVESVKGIDQKVESVKSIGQKNDPALWYFKPVLSIISFSYHGAGS